MKIQKIILAFCIFLCLNNTGLAQASGKDIVDRTVPITWLGLDFTNAKFIGDRERFGSFSDIKYLIRSWNDLIEHEYERKYNIGAALRKSKVDMKLDITNTHNDGLDVAEMLSNDKADHLRLNEDDITTTVSQYDFQGLSGLGLMFNVESFDKLKDESVIWITFIDLSSKEVILTQRIQEHPGGANLRNLWGGSVAATIDRMRGREFDSWKKKYGSGR
jgi:hypothetical protein